MGTSSKPVYSSELNKRFHGIAQLRLQKYNNIHLVLGDSRAMLHQLQANSKLHDATLFFYLDAHFYEDLPLREEIDLIVKYWKNFIIMIDDFQVPDDPGYGYDDYGRNGVLTFNYISDVLHKHRLLAWVPTIPSHRESGYRRGCALLAKRIFSDTLNNISELRLVDRV